MSLGEGSTSLTPGQTVRPQCRLAGHCREGVPESRVAGGGGAKAGGTLVSVLDSGQACVWDLLLCPGACTGTLPSGVWPEWGFCALIFWCPNFSNPK